MECDECKDLLTAYLDDELTSQEYAMVSAHIEICSACEQVYAEEFSLHQHCQHLPRHTASPDFIEQIKAIPLEADKRFVRQENSLYWLWRLVKNPYLTHAFVAVVTILAMNSLLTSHYKADWQQQEAYGAHIRGLMSSPGVQIRSSDKHQIGPWFAGKLDFAPKVQDLSEQGFELIGARADYMRQQKVAVLIYKRRRHFISVLIVPHFKAGINRPISSRHNGYHYINIQKGDFSYSVISDLNMEELETFSNYL